MLQHLDSLAQLVVMGQSHTLRRFLGVVKVTETMDRVCLVLECGLVEQALGGFVLGRRVDPHHNMVDSLRHSVLAFQVDPGGVMAQLGREGGDAGRVEGGRKEADLEALVAGAALERWVWAGSGSGWWGGGNGAGGGDDGELALVELGLSLECGRRLMGVYLDVELGLTMSRLFPFRC